MESNVNRMFLPPLTHNLFHEVERVYQEEGKLTDELLLALHSVFGPPFERALELLEKDCVTLLTTADGTRQALQVCGSRRDLYTLFPYINYCPCPAYAHQVASRHLYITCKHVLAARLSQITGRTTKKEASAQEVARILYSASAATIEGHSSLP